MKRIRWVVIPILFMLACSMLPLAFTGPVQANEGKSNLAELTAGADSVIVGTVVERSSYWNDEHTGIYTSAVLSIEEGLKGTVGRDRITVTLPGGEADGIGQWVSDVPSFDQGEKAVVFLKKLSTAQLPKTKAYKTQLPEEQFEVYRGYQGKFAIKQGKVDSLPESKFKERVRKVAQGQTLPEDELYVPSSIATFPYSYSGYCWPHPPDPVVGYLINENTADCTGEGAAVQTAAATWNAPANFSFSYTGATAATGYSYNTFNEVLWKNFGSGGTIAHAIFWYSGSTILENDIEFNDYYVWSAAASCPGGQFDVETIALHELGHWLCLNDLYDAADAAKVMYGYGSTGTTKRALHADDITGIQFIYGASASGGTQKLIGTATDGTNNSGTAGYGHWTKFTCDTSGTVSEIRVQVAGNTNLKVAIYADAGANAPSTRLGYNNTATACSAGWNTITLTQSASVTQGTVYWLAVAHSADAVAKWRPLAGSQYRWAGNIYSGGFADPAPATTLTPNYEMTIAGWGSPASPPEPPPAPAPLSPGTAITFKWGTATGATNYWLQVNTASNFTGTDMFNAEVGNITSQEVTSLSLGITYYWRVKAGNASGWGPWSSVRSVLANTVP